MVSDWERCFASRSNYDGCRSLVCSCSRAPPLLLFTPFLFLSLFLLSFFFSFFFFLFFFFLFFFFLSLLFLSFYLLLVFFFWSCLLFPFFHITLSFSRWFSLSQRILERILKSRDSLFFMCSAVLYFHTHTRMFLTNFQRW